MVVTLTLDKLGLGKLDNAYQCAHQAASEYAAVV